MLRLRKHGFFPCMASRLVVPLLLYLRQIFIITVVCFSFEVVADIISQSFALSYLVIPTPSLPIPINPQLTIVTIFNLPQELVMESLCIATVIHFVNDTIRLFPIVFKHTYCQIFIRNINFGFVDLNATIYCLVKSDRAIGSTIGQPIPLVSIQTRTSENPVHLCLVFLTPKGKLIT